MINIFIKRANFNYKLQYGLNSIIMNNKPLFRRIYNNFLEELVITENCEEIGSSKIIILDNLLNLDINDKKIITDLYKQITKETNSNYNEEKNKLLERILELVDLLASDLSLKIDYEIEYDLIKIFQAIDLKYKPNDDFTSNLLDYIKTRYGYNIKLIVTFNMKNILNCKEIEILNSELEKNQYICLDISTITEKCDDNYLFIDEDLCII